MTNNEMNITNTNEMEGDTVMTNNTINFDAEKNAFTTKKDAYNFLINHVRENPVETYQTAVLTFLEHEVELLNKKAQRTTAKKEENPINKKIAELVVEVLADNNKEMTLSELIEDARLATYIDEKGVEKKMTVQKISFCVGMVEDQVTKRKVKGKMVYSLAK